MLLETTQFYKSVAGMFYEANVQKDGDVRLLTT